MNLVNSPKDITAVKNAATVFVIAVIEAEFDLIVSNILNKRYIRTCVPKIITNIYNNRQVLYMY